MFAGSGVHAALIQGVELTFGSGDAARTLTRVALGIRVTRPSVETRFLGAVVTVILTGVT